MRWLRLSLTHECSLRCICELRIEHTPMRARTRQRSESVKRWWPRRRRRRSKVGPVQGKGGCWGRRGRRGSEVYAGCLHVTRQVPACVRGVCSDAYLHGSDCASRRAGWTCQAYCEGAQVGARGVGEGCVDREGGEGQGGEGCLGGCLRGCLGGARESQGLDGGDT